MPDHGFLKPLTVVMTLAGVCVMGLLTSLASGQSAPAVSSGSVAPVSDLEIAKLIEGLGADSYATRVRSRRKLATIGLAAFDQLRLAQDHMDNEIAIVARQLTGGPDVPWSEPGDSPRVRQLLREYGSFTVPQRREKIVSLSVMPREEAFAALVRLARHDTDPSLNRFAALSLMRRDDSDDEQHRHQYANMISATVGERTEPSCQWLRQYAADLRSGEYTDDAWSRLIQQGRQSLIAIGDEESQDLLELVKVCAERAVRADRHADALRLVRAQIDLVPPTTRDLSSMATWAIDHQLQPVVITMRKLQSRIFDQSAILLYCAAEAHQLESEPEQAELLAAQALAFDPLPVPPEHGSDQAPEPVDTAIVMEHAQSHCNVAVELEHRGLFQWSRREYELVIERLPIESNVASGARLQLSQMLGEQLLHEEVIRVLQPLTDRLDRDDELRRRLVASRLPYPTIRSELEFHRGLLAVKTGDLTKARVALRQAFEMNPTNIDILIAMYRVDGDEAWRTYVKETLDRNIRHSENEVQAAQDAAGRIGPFATSPSTLASKLNQYAWLVSNTEGDFAQALQYSKLSLQKSPDEPAMMDTCARCYAAVGDYASAVEMQRRACELMPHSPPLLRQLKEFQDKLTAQPKANPS